MRRFRLYVAGLSVVAVLVILLMAEQSSASAQNQPSTLSPLSLQQMKAQSSIRSNNVGRPAIAPSAAAANSAGSPRIKSTDAEAYVTKHGFPSGPLVSEATLKVLSIDLITSKVAADRLHGEQTGLPDTSLVYYVKLQGPFTTTGVHAPPQAHISPTTEYGVEVFDAQTGNLLIWALSD